jgi:hypothetical protein
MTEQVRPILRSYLDATAWRIAQLWTLTDEYAAQLAADIAEAWRTHTATAARHEHQWIEQHREGETC